MHTNNTTTTSPILFTEKDLVRPLRHFPETVVITKELLFLRMTIARNIALKSDTTLDYGWAWCQADCCLWDYEGFLQNN